MKTFTMKYPGDPAVKIEVLNREEFFQLFPPKGRRVTITGFSSEGKFGQESYELGTKINCDFCNEDPHDEIYLVGRARAYCRQCFDTSLKRYCKEVK